MIWRSEVYDLTADQLTSAIASAIRDHAFDAVVDLLAVLSNIDPKRAQEVYDAIQAGIAIGRRDRIPDADDLARKLREAL